MHIEHTKGARQPAGVNKWKFSDVVVLDWDVGEQREDAFVLDRALLEVKRSLGEQPFRLSSVELKVELVLNNFREHFFQCVSNSKWAHMAHLVVASPISDALLATELRRAYARSRRARREVGPPAYTPTAGCTSLSERSSTTYSGCTRGIRTSERFAHGNYR
jgi:hypothetical protein